MSYVALHPSERAALKQAMRPSTRRKWRRAALIAVPIVAIIALLAQALLTMLPASAAASRQHRAPSSSAAPARLPDPAAIASPGGGATGTATLPPIPIGAVPAAALVEAPGGGIIPAAPFTLRGASSLDRARALECLTSAIYYEAASEPDDGQRAVAQVVLNRVRHPAFPATVCGVIYQGSDRASGCQFSYACDGSMARIPSRSAWARAARNAAAALGGYVFAPVGLATHYHTYAVTPAWNRPLVMTDAIGAHFFHRWKGYWGTASAFHQRYRGNEPVPGPLPKATIPLPAIALARPVPVAPPVTAPAQIQPAHQDSGAPIAPSAASAATAESQILDRWKDSGKPLR
ncbi:cell wall hydrolase [Sphingomonas sp. NBWT7]|uniref:cell wall hydrolase n=1 Tax=Sphingomonas sp. NBWT7 TaxID=2596913 RepID=UPI0021560D31|nr:cell wall hydrolase [Sphingomonas sp. NBWT7]